MPILPIPIKNKSHWVPVWKGNYDLSLSLLILCLLNMKLQPEYSQFNLAERASITASLDLSEKICLPAPTIQTCSTSFSPLGVSQTK